MGRDSDLFENKFLNWWTALEYLLRTGDQGNIISEVEKKLVPALVPNYFTKHLESYKNTISLCGIKSIRELSVKDLFDLIRDESKYKDLESKVSSIPAVQFRLEKFSKKINNNNSLKTLLENHEKHLRWHVHRIWRVRCDIVHSAEYSINLTLLCANLEYYLKSLLYIILEYLNRNNSVKSLKELFDRLEHEFQILQKELHENKTDFLYKYIERPVRM